MKVADNTQASGVWWYVRSTHTGTRGKEKKITVYTRTEQWFDARAVLGGHPKRVVDPKVLRNLEKSDKDHFTKQMHREEGEEA